MHCILIDGFIWIYFANSLLFASFVHMVLRFASPVPLMAFWSQGRYQITYVNPKITTLKEDIKFLYAIKLRFDWSLESEPGVPLGQEVLYIGGCLKTGTAQGIHAPWDQLAIALRLQGNCPAKTSTLYCVQAQKTTATTSHSRRRHPCLMLRADLWHVLAFFACRTSVQPSSVDFLYVWTPISKNQ